jgi:hypothetical protein
MRNVEGPGTATKLLVKASNVGLVAVFVDGHNHCTLTGEL